MKKFSALMMVALVGSAMAFTSCNKKKDWNCKCEVTLTGTSSSTTQTLPLNDQKKSDAEDACDAAEVTYTTAASTANCSLSEK